jgi:hypothetical protein
MVRKILLATMAALWGLAFPTFAAGPVLTRMHPLGALPGINTELIFKGDNLGGATKFWTSFPCQTSVTEDAEAAKFTLVIPRETRPGLGALRLVTTNGLSSLQLFLIDQVASQLAGGTNDSPASAQRLNAPIAVDGECREVRSDFYRVHARRGERILIEVVAQRLGSPLDPLLRLLDTQGRELAAVDDSPGLGADPRLEFRVPQSGDYLIEVRDTRYSGGPRHRYRLRLGEPLPSPLPFHITPELAAITAAFALPNGTPEREPNDQQPQPITLPVELTGRFNKKGDRDVYEFAARKGERWLFSGRTRSLGSAADLLLQLRSTNGVTLAEANANSGDEGRLTNRFNETGTYQLAIEELNHLGGPGLDYRIAMQPLPPGFSLSVETERFAVPAGDSFEIEVQVARRDYEGPIALKLHGLEERFAVTNAVIPAKTNQIRLKVIAPEDLTLGELFHFGLTGSAEIAGRDVSAPANTLAALREVLPGLLYPPPQLNGLLTLSISDSKSAEPRPQRKRRK